MACEFVQLDVTLPKYLIRHFNETIFFALFQLINPILILVAAFILPFTTLLERVPALLLMVLGTLLQASSPFWNVVTGMGKLAVPFFLTQFSLGESLSQPLLNEMAMKMAPRGQEAFYASSVTAPKLAARLLGLGMSGGLLSQFCPNASECAIPAIAPLMIWVVTGAVAFITPTGLLLLWWRKWIR